MKTAVIKALAGLLAVGAAVYCIFAYLYAQPLLLPGLPDPVERLFPMQACLMACFVIMGVYHLYLLAIALKSAVNRQKRLFLHSLLIVLTVLSGISLLSDVTLLSDIGKEYRLFDVASQWNMLYGFTVFHLIVMAYGCVFTLRNESSSVRLFKAIRNGSDALFLCLNQICLLSGLGGLGGVLLASIGWFGDVLPERYRTGWLLVLSGLALLPVALFAVYWLVKNRKKPLSRWLDEKQMADMAAGALVSLAVALPVVILLVLLHMTRVLQLAPPFYLLAVFFAVLVALPAAVMARSGTPGQSG